MQWHPPTGAMKSPLVIITISFQIHNKLFPITVLAHDMYDLWFSQLAKHTNPFGQALRSATYHGFF